MNGKHRKKAEEEAEKLRKDFGITDSAGLLLLESFTAVYATELECQESIETHGMVIKDRFGAVKPHPLLPTLRDARSQKLQCLKALGFDIIDSNHQGPGRPPRGY